MGDIAEAAAISRPTLYAAFANKEAIMTALVEQHTQECATESATRIAHQRSLKGRLRVLFDVYVIEPFEGSAENPTVVT